MHDGRWWLLRRMKSTSTSRSCDIREQFAELARSIMRKRAARKLLIVPVLSIEINQKRNCNIPTVNLSQILEDHWDDLTDPRTPSVHQRPQAEGVLTPS